MATAALVCNEAPGPRAIAPEIARVRFPAQLQCRLVALYSPERSVPVGLAGEAITVSIHICAIRGFP